MSDPREMLAMLNPHGIEIGKPFGGIPSLTPLDIAGAMGMGHIRREMGLLRLAKYTGDETVIPELRRRTRDEVTVMASERAWKSENLPKRIKALADIALA